MIEGSEFYMVLPSNASPNMHPNNTSTDFTVTLQTPIKLSPNKSWKVALMEMTYSHERIRDCGIIYRFYGEWRPVFTYKLTLSYPEHTGAPKFMTFGDTEGVSITIQCSVYQDVLGFWSKKPFQMKTSQGKEVLSKYHEYWSQYYCNDDVAVSSYFTKKAKTIKEFSIIPYFYIDHESVFRFPKEVLIRSPFEVVQYMIASCSGIFNELRIEDNIVKFGLGERVYSIKFCDGLGELIGFKNKDKFQATASEKEMLSLYPDYKRALSTFQGTAMALIKDSTHNFHILSDICKNIDFGNRKLPLLKSISMDISSATGNHGYMRNVIVPQPMYVDVRNKIISKVHIDIRTAANKKIYFQNGSNTVITLHFKCS